MEESCIEGDNDSEKVLSRHLDYIEMKSFLEIKEFKPESIRLIARVNGHLMNCKKCVMKFEAYKKYKK